MRASGRRRLSWAATLLLALVIAAAGAAASAATAPTRQNLTRARTEASRLLGLVQLPPGAVRSAVEPAGDDGALAQPGFDEMTPNLVDARAWWTSSAPPTDVLAYVAAHLPPGARLNGSGSGGISPQAASQIFRLPPIGGVLSERVLAVTVVPLPDGTTGVRTDGEAVWLTPRPRWERIPNSAGSVTFTSRAATGDGRLQPWSRPVTITGARARHLRTFINALPVVQPGTVSCPADFGSVVKLTFATAAGRTVARATEHPSGCPSVSLVVARRAGPALSDVPSVTGELRRLGAIRICRPRTTQPLGCTP